MRSIRNVKAYRRFVAPLATALPLIVSHPVFADTTSSVAGVSNIEDFIKSVTTVIVAVCGAVAIVMFAIGGFSYVVSSGNPEHLQRAKHTLLYAAIGLAIAIASAILGSIVTTLATNAFGS
ncbi:MAG TPA: hypothetical protein VMB52_00500 [Verrucomicrobiae bacterium]|nr:hypothetical protein [Verrucomicrobiae bacterium]